MNIYYTATCFDQLLVTFRPVCDTKTKLQLQIHSVVTVTSQSFVSDTCQYQ
jgi:hypothetical protein